MYIGLIGSTCQMRRDQKRDFRGAEQYAGPREKVQGLGEKRLHKKTHSGYAVLETVKVLRRRHPLFISFRLRFVFFHMMDHILYQVPPLTHTLHYFSLSMQTTFDKSGSAFKVLFLFSHFFWP